jgi:hypothetical protein
MALDSGGSTTLAFDGQVLNAPSGGAQRAVANALMVVYTGVYAPAPRESVVSPNGDGVAEDPELGYKVVTPSKVNARLVGPGDKPVWKDQGRQEPGTYPAGPPVGELENGRYRLLVSAVDDEGVESQAERAFVVNRTLGHLQASPGVLRTTRKRGATLDVSFRLAKAARVAVTVEAAAGGLVDTLASGSRRPSGTVALTWDARTAAGKVVPPGSYVVRVTARNALGTVALTDTVTVRRGR